VKKILILGAKGMAGHMIANYLRSQKKYHIFTTARCDDESPDNFYLDVFDTQKLIEIIDKIKPDYVINCIGVLVKFSKDNPEKAIFINAYLPRFLDKLSNDFNYKLIHLSSDCVFSGSKGQYTELNIPDEIDIYGKSKALGEIDHSKNLTIRTSIIGPELKKNGVGLFHWFMQTKGSIGGYTRVIWSGVTTLELAKFIDYLITDNVQLSGLYHLVNNDSISKKDLLLLFKRIFYKEDVTIYDDQGVVSDKSIVNTLSQIEYKVPGYDRMVQEMYDWMMQYPEMYASYSNQE